MSRSFERNGFNASHASMLAATQFIDSQRRAVRIARESCLPRMVQTVFRMLQNADLSGK
jgi:hypothetical protein